MTVPTNQRSVRTYGLLRCCRDSLSRSNRPTDVGAEAQCPVCQAEVVVDAQGAWKWVPPQRG